MPVPPLTPAMIEANYASGVWQPRPLHAVIDEVAERRPDAPAVADQHERLSYRDLVRRSHMLAAWLLGLGLEPGDAVAVQAPNRIALALTHLACDRADLLYVPLSNSWRTTELAHLLSVSRTRVLIVPQADRRADFLAMAHELRPRLPALKHVGTLDGPAPGADFDFDTVSSRGSARVDVPRDPNAPRYVMVTSGTTDLPRASLWSDNNLWCFMRMFIGSTELTDNDVAVGLCPANTGATGYVYAVLAPLLVGASSVLLEEWSPVNALDLIERERATTVTAVPTQVLKMLQEDSLGKRDFSALRVFTNAGAALPPHAARALEEAFGCVSQVCYGATDGGVPAMTHIRDSPEKRYTTVGRVSDIGRVKLVDTLGNEVPKGQPGELWWSSPTKSFGYLNEPDRDAAAFTGDGWYRSGDLARVDADGYLGIVGRAKDLIIRGGQNISPQELENLLAQHPSVGEVSVIGVPDAIYGERTCACVVPSPGREPTLAEIVAFLAERDVAKFKLPERLEFFTELPRSAGGKTSKVELRAAVAQRDAAIRGKERTWTE
ncbi:AMP-binding protein [Acrocarpospora catenulata]|uniref:AMP-binding protein n=1 Tax=Acrocarpospora catenulata TaxID=2836182 RepID=UPI001BD9D46E|nr:AMP-binding protein [Acrocarpospora catenulata]